MPNGETGRRDLAYGAGRRRDLKGGRFRLQGLASLHYTLVRLCSPHSHSHAFKVKQCNPTSLSEFKRSPVHTDSSDLCVPIHPPLPCRQHVSTTVHVLAYHTICTDRALKYTYPVRNRSRQASRSVRISKYAIPRGEATKFGSQ